MTNYIEDCDLYAASSYAVAISHGNRVTRKVPLKARVDVETGEVRLYIDPARLDTLQN